MVMIFIEVFLGEVFQSSPIQILVAGHPADGAFHCCRLYFDATDDPLEYTDVLAKAGPYKIAVFVLAEPVES
jgi:hypothetical protein